MKLTRKNIEEYIERFLDGRTTCAEERALYEYFRNEDIPSEWEYLRKAFDYFENGMREEKTGEVSFAEPARQPKRRSGMAAWRPPRKAARWCAAASAAIIAATGTWIAVSHDEGAANDVESLYDGSYMILNGEYCNDVEEMDYHIDIAMERAEIMEIKAARLLAMAERQTNSKTI